jgi:hypothetical protein
VQARGPTSGKPGRCNKTLTCERTRWEAYGKSLALGEHQAKFLQNGVTFICLPGHHPATYRDFSYGINA